MKKVLLIFLVIALGFALFMASAFVGNPVSEYLSKRSAVNYVEEKFKDKGYKLEKTLYNFKGGHYDSMFKKPGSIDEFFSVSCDWKGKIKYDDYDYAIGEKFNTYIRLDSELRKYTDPILYKNFNLVDNSFGFISYNKEKYNTKDLELNEKFHINNIPIEKEVVLYIDQNEVSYMSLAELVLKIEKVLSEENINVDYYSITIMNRAKNDLIENQEVGVYDLKYDEWKSHSESVEELAKFLKKSRENWDRIH